MLILFDHGAQRSIGNPQRPAVHRYIDRVVAAVNAAMPGSYTEVDIPY